MTTTGSRLRRQRRRVLEAWESKVRATVPAARAQPAPVLIDSIPDLIDELSVTLDAPVGGTSAQRGAAHGRQRAEVTAYPLDQVIAEYDVLRQVLIACLEEEGPLSPLDRDRVVDGIAAAVREACREFVRVRDRERDQAQAALQAAHRDLDDRFRARTAELRHAEERFTRLVEGVRDYAIFTVDPVGHVTSWNLGAERMKGYHPQEIIGAHFSILYTAEGNRRDEPMTHLRIAALEGRFRGEGIRVRKNGDRYLADVLITPMYEGEQLVGFSKVVQDLTERNLLMQERDLSRVDVERLQVERERRERFVAMLTHDLRTPLTTARNAAELLAISAEDPVQVRRWSRRTVKAIDEVAAMINDLLDANRIQAGEPLPLSLEPCDLRPIIDDVIAAHVVHHGDRFVVRVDGDVRGRWSRSGLRRLLDNLVSNAVKYGAPAQPITVEARRIEARVLLTVHNQGTIIPVEEQAKVFEPFHRTPAAEASGQPGWGLGLTLVRGIADAHHATVKVESYAIEGTTFTVDLPVEPAAADPPTTKPIRD